MRCRQYIKYKNELGEEKTDVVWFNSYGKNISNSSLRTNNFANDNNAISQLLTQKLSILKGELWDNISYGLPLLEKQKSKYVFDSFIISTIEQNKNIIKIVEFNYKIYNNEYFANMIISTDFGDLELSI